MFIKSFWSKRSSSGNDKGVDIRLTFSHKTIKTLDKLFHNFLKATEGTKTRQKLRKGTALRDIDIYVAFPLKDIVSSAQQSGRTQAESLQALRMR